MNSPHSKLSEVISGMRLGRSPATQVRSADLWLDLGRGCIHAWAFELERDLELALDGLTRAKAEVGAASVPLAGMEPARRHVEETLWRLVAAKEKFDAVFALAFGVPSLRLYRSGVRFEPETSAAKKKLRDLARDHPRARDLADIWERVLQHPAITLRDQLIHGLAPIAQARPLVYIEVGRFRGDSVVAYEFQSIYPEGTIEHGSIGAEDVFQRAVELCHECWRLLHEGIDALADLIETAAVLEPPQHVFVPLDGGKTQLERP